MTIALHILDGDSPRHPLYRGAVMPTALPSSRARARGCSVTWRQVGRILVFTARMRILSRRMARLHRRVGFPRSDRDNARLLDGARRWLGYSAAIAETLGAPEPSETARLREMLMPDGDTSPVRSDFAHARLRHEPQP